MTTKLTDLMREKFPSQLKGDSLNLVAGVYHVTGFEIADSENFNKIMYLHTKQGEFRTTSKNVIGSFTQSVGEVITKALTKGDPFVEVEIISKKANTGNWGIAVRAFENVQ